MPSSVSGNYSGQEVKVNTNKKPLTGAVYLSHSDYGTLKVLRSRYLPTPHASAGIFCSFRIYKISSFLEEHVEREVP